MDAPFHLLFVVAAILLSGFAAGFTAEPWPHRLRLVAAALCCFFLSTIVHV